VVRDVLGKLCHERGLKTWRSEVFGTIDGRPFFSTGRYQFVRKARYSETIAQGLRGVRDHAVDHGFELHRPSECRPTLVAYSRRIFAFYAASADADVLVARLVVSVVGVWDRDTFGFWLHHRFVRRSKSRCLLVRYYGSAAASTGFAWT
jgi:hypothetical protein